MTHTENSKIKGTNLHYLTIHLLIPPQTDLLISISLRKLEGDYKQLIDDYPHLVLGNTAVARKMGFPDVIYPNDVRNDVYVTILEGEFAPQMKNVQVTLSVHDKDGVQMTNVICDGSGGNLVDYKVG